MHLLLRSALAISVLGASSCASHASPRPAAPACVAQMSRPQLDALVKRLHAIPEFAQRVDVASGAFVGTPYVIDPLGEGPGHTPDADPTSRYDGVDCVTYVEEVLALCNSSSLAEAEKLLQQIRYLGDTVTYTDRNHFMESEWIPSNERKGFVKNVTAEVGGPDVIHDVRTISMAQWKARADALQLNLPDDRAPVGHFDLVALPLDKVEAHAGQIPEGSILVVAHRSDEKTTNRYSHLGFVVRHDGKVFVRHASSLKHAVIEDTLAEFVAKNRKYVQWPVSGFVFLQPLPAQPATAAR
jgi:hypothetical protein